MSALSDPRLFAAPRPPADLLVRGAHVLDPRTGLDGVHDILVRDGEIAEIGAPDTLECPDGAETLDATGRHLFPAFTDPHVHLRTPGQEYKEDIATGSAAAAAGGFCQIVAMPNTSPTVDTAAVLGSLVAQARTQARVPTGFLAAITHGLTGDELTEMAELRDTGAIGFTDDGKPVTSAGMLRKALQYQRLCGGIIALHEEDPALSGDGVMHEGGVSARLGMAGIPSISESTMVARDASIALFEDARVHFQHLSCAESVQALAAARAAGARVSRGGQPPPPDADRGGGPQPRQPLQDEPAAAHGIRPPGAHRRRSRTGRSNASPPTTPPTPSTRRRSPSSRRRWGPPGWRRPSRPSTQSWCSAASSPSTSSSSG